MLGLFSSNINLDKKLACAHRTGAEAGVEVVDDCGEVVERPM